jgi:hypothetical protein
VKVGFIFGFWILDGCILGKWLAYVGVAWYLWDEYCIVVNRVGYTSVGIIAGLEMVIRLSPHFRTTLP